MAKKADKKEAIETELKQIVKESKQKEQKEVLKKEPAAKGYLVDKLRIITEDSNAARELYNKSRFGALVESKVELGLIEAYYLADKGKVEVYDLRNKIIIKSKLFGLVSKREKNFWVKYCVYKDLRDRGYIVKTALKFGADFRVYDRGIFPGEDHAKWIVYPVHEKTHLTWHDFSAKNRVAHSTKKRLLLGIVDEEGDVSYWESRWLRP